MFNIFFFPALKCGAIEIQVQVTTIMYNISSLTKILK